MGTAREVVARLLVDASQAKGELDSMAANAEASAEEMRAAMERAGQSIGQVIAQGDDLSGKRWTPTIDLNSDPLQRKIDAVEARLTQLRDSEYRARVGLDADAADAELHRLEARLDRFRTIDATAKAKVDTGDSNEKLDLLSAKMDALSGSTSALMGTAAALGPALIPVLATVTAGVGALLPVVAAAGIGFGALGVLAIPVLSDVTKGAQNVQTAQDALNKAVKDYGPLSTQAKTATQNLNAAWAQMTPLEQQVTHGILDLKKEVKDLGAQIAPQVLGTFSIFLNDAKILLPQLVPLAREAALALGDLGKGLGRDFNSASFKGFLDFIQGEIRPAIDTLGIVFNNLVKGIGYLVEAFAPLAPAIERDMQRITAAFAAWAGDQIAGAGFQKFIEYVKTNGPLLAQTLASIGQLAETLVKDLAGFGTVDLKALTVLAQGLNSIASIPDIGPTVVQVGLLAFAFNKFIPLAAVPTLLRGLAAGLREIASVGTLGGTVSGIGALGSALEAIPFVAIGTAMAAGILDAFSKSFDEMITRNVPQWAQDIIHGFAAAAVIVVGSVAGAALLPVVAIVAAFDEGFRNTIKQHVPKWVGSVLDGIASVPKAIENFFVQTIPHAFVAGFNAVAGVVTTAVAPIVNAVTVAWHAVESVTTTVWNAITGFLDHWWHALILVFGPIGVAVDFVTTNWHAIQSITVGVFNAVSSFLTGVWNTVTGAISSAVGTVTHVVQTGWALIQGVTTAVWGAISGFLGGIWNAISGVATSVFNAIKGVITSIWGAIQGNTSGTWGAISGFLSGLWDGIRNTATGVFGAIKDFITSAVHEMADAIHAAWDPIAGFFTKVWDDVKTAFATGIDTLGTVLNPFIDVADKALSLLGIPVNIPDLPHLASGGTVGLEVVPMLAGGGNIGNGFMTTGPTAVVGEGRAQYPEYVIPTDPMYRGNAAKLHAGLTYDLGLNDCGGACGMAMGGTLSKSQVAAYAAAGVPLAGFGLHSIVGGAESIGGDIIGGAKSIGGAIVGGLEDIAGTALGIIRGDAASILTGLAHGIGWPWPVSQNIEGVVPATADKAVQGMIDFVAGKQKAQRAMSAGGAGMGGSGPPVSGQCGDWINQGLALAGSTARMSASCLMARAMHESNCDPRANGAGNGDINARNGNPSLGLMQFVPSTFAANSVAGCTDIWNPICQVAASAHCDPGNCGVSGYGCASGGILGSGILPPIRSYDSGGILPPGLSLSYNGTGSAEVVNPRGGQGVVLTDNRQIHLYGDASSPASRAVIREELDHDRAETLRHLRALRGAA